MTKFVIQSSVLKDALKVAGKNISRKNLVRILDDALFVAVKDTGRLYVTAGDSDAFTTMILTGVGIEEEGRFCVEMGTMLPAVSALPDCPITIEAGDNKVKVSYPNGHFSLPMENAEDYPLPKDDIEDAYEMDLPVANLCKAIAQATPQSEDNQLRPQMAGICLDFPSGGGLNVAGTNGNRLLFNHIDGINEILMGGRQVNVPLTAAILLESLLEVSADRSEKTVRLRTNGKMAIFNDGWNFRLCTKLHEGNYPNYKAVMPTTCRTKVDIDRKALVNSVKRLVGMTSKDSKMLRFSFDYIELTIKAADVDFNKSGEERLQCSMEGYPITIGMQASGLLSILNVLDTEHVELRMTDPNCAIRIRPVAADYSPVMETDSIVMPMLLE